MSRHPASTTPTPSSSPPDEPPTVTFPRWFKAALKSAGKSQTEFASYGIVSLPTVNRWTIEGVPRNADTVIEIARALAPDQVADALAAAGFHRTAEYVRGTHALAEHDPVILRIRRETRLTPQERDNMIADHRRRMEEAARLLDAELANTVRARRRRARDQGEGQERRDA